MKSSIRTAMYRAVSLLIIIPVLLLSLILSYIYSIKLENVIEDSLEAVAAAQIAEMDSFCERQKNNLEIIGEMDLSRAALNGELDGNMLQYLNNMLYSRVQMTDYLKSISIIASDSRVVACSLDVYDSVARREISFLYEDMKGNPFCITDVLTITGSGEEHKAVAAIFRVEDNGRVLGYVLAEIDLSFYDEIRQRVKLWNESTFYLLDGKGKIIIAGTPEENRDIFVTTAEERQDYIKKYDAIDFSVHPQGSFQYKINGKNYITYYSNTQYTNWKILLTVNMDNYLEQRMNYAATACILVLFCSVLAFWIGKFTSERIVRPIKHVTDILGGIKKTQDYNQRVTVECQDELGTLSDEINQLLSLIETESLYQAQERRLLQEKADHDALTKVLNKEKVMQLLQEAIVRCQRSCRKLAVLFVDVDDFKSFNSKYGHGVGDQVLLFIASLLKQETGGIVGRVGGDEFLAIVESPEHLQTLEDSLKRVNQITESQFVIRGTAKRQPVNVCIGTVLADFSNPDLAWVTAEQVTAWADSAMYQAKNNGKRGYVIYHTEDCVERMGEIWND